MATEKELRVEQKRRLTMLLRIRNTKDPSMRDKLIADFITDTRIEMDAEDVAYVQQTLEGTDNA